MEKALTINQAPWSIRCRLFCSRPEAVRTLLVYSHGFGGSKDGTVPKRLAEKLLSKHKDAALLAFDWPCHGTDGRKSLLLSDCDAYLEQVLRYVERRYHPERLWGMATSFGGFLFLRHLLRRGNPFERLVLRCPAVNFPRLLDGTLLTPEAYRRLRSGKAVTAGFERKLKLTRAFAEELDRADLEGLDFRAFAPRLLIVHGEKDRVIPIETVRAFARRNGIAFLGVENADHGFQDPKRLDCALHAALEFFSQPQQSEG